MKALYDAYRNSALVGNQVAWLTDTVKWVLVDAADYTLSLSAHTFLSDIPAAARVATSPALANKTAVAGVADADDVVIAAATGDQAEALVLFVDTGNAATSRLILYTDEGTGLPVQPNGGDITIAHDNTAGVRIFKL